MPKKLAERLKPCPFCGSEATLKPCFGGYAWHIRCENPDCEVRPHTNAFTTPEDAIKDWNRRACE